VYPGHPVVVSIDLPFDPKPKERPRTVMDMGAIERAFLAARGRIEVFRAMVGKGASRTFTPKTTKSYEELIAIASAAAMAGRKPFECPVEVRILFTLKGNPEKWPTSAADGDGDNMEKAVLDAMNGIVFVDDRLVVRCAKEKSCGPNAGVVIEIRPADPAPFFISSR
jgi:Holliday junction resolvase RusA-like endonuclease